MMFFPPLKIGIVNAWLFMSVFLLQMLVMALFNRGAWERSHVPAKARTNTLDRFTGGLANIIWLLILFYSLFLPLQRGTVWFFLGLGLFLLGFFMLLIATVNFITSAPDRVIDTGVYRLSRHPMYVATFLICMGTGVAVVSGLLVILSILMGAAFRREAMIEESYCLERYGRGYQDYMDGTPRFLGMPGKMNR
jgi:protein-S-isoprenylcysteine O-methyltransferase Ste14